MGLKLITKIADSTLKEFDRRLNQLQADLSAQEKEIRRDHRILTARALYNQSQFDDALAQINEAILELPSKNGYLLKAVILRAKDLVENAIQVLEQRFSAPPDRFTKNNASLHWNKACYLNLLKSNDDEILEQLTKSLSLEPSNFEDLRKDNDLKDFVDKPGILEILRR